MKILFVIPYAPTPVRSRPYHLIRALADRGHHVTVATLWRSAAEHRGMCNALAGVEAFVGAQASTWRSIWNATRALPTGQPMQAHFSWHQPLARTLSSLVRQQQFDVVHVEHLRGARYALALADALAAGGGARSAVVWDSVDCISDLMRQAAARGRGVAVRWVARLELPRTERYEAAVVSRFARVLVTSVRDRDSLLQLAARHGHARTPPVERVVVLPNGVDLERFTPPRERREEATLVMSGKMSYHANVAAVLRFADDVLPKILARRRDVRFVIVGQDPPADVRRLAQRPGVSVTGTVDDVRPYLQRATIAVAPIDYGVGIQNKVLESFACATPVVATSAAIHALGVTSGRELATADRPEEFAREVLRLLQSPEERSRLGQAGRRYVESHHGWSAICRRLEDVYADAASAAVA